jgi:hypothetical protein
VDKYDPSKFDPFNKLDRLDSRLDRLDSTLSKVDSTTRRRGCVTCKSGGRVWSIRSDDLDRYKAG